MTDAEKQAALEAIPGLTFADAFKFFNEKATERDRAIADMVDTNDELEVDGAILSEGDDDGAWVNAWVWVPFESCAECGAVEGTPEWGTVGDGFDGYCPSCADKREEQGVYE